MKFYFCEKCGKRLTDQEIAAGEGKNKKLRGVFCNDCSVGVMTMETLPITDSDAQKIVAQHASTTPKPVPARHEPASPRRRTSSIRAAQSATKTQSDHRRASALRRTTGQASHATHEPARRKKSYAFIWGLAAGIAAFVGLGIALTMDGGSKAPGAHEAGAPRAPSDAESKGGRDTSQPPQVKSTPPVTEPQPPALATPTPTPTAAGGVLLADLPAIDPKIGWRGPYRPGYIGPTAITWDGKRSPKSLGLHPTYNGASEVTYALNGQYTRLETRAGIDDSRTRDSRTPLTFEVLGDGKQLWISKPIRNKNTPQACLIDVSGVKLLMFKVHCPGPFNHAFAVWHEPRILTADELLSVQHNR